MTRQSVLLFLITLCLSVTASAQLQVDSLRDACVNGSDSLRADAYLQIGKQYFVQFAYTDSLINNSRKALAIAEKTGNAIQKFQAKKQIAVGYVQAGDSANAVVAANAALQEAQDSRDSTHIADIFHLYASLYGNLGMTDTALAYLVREAETAIAVQYYNATAIAYSSIAWIYRGRQQFDKMLFYHRKALAIVNKMEPTVIGNIIQVYVTSSQGYLLSGQHDSSEVLVDSAKVLADSVLALSVRYSRNPPQASAYWVYAQHALFYKQFESAEKFALKALEFRNFIPDRSILIMYTTIAAANAHLKNPARALLYLDSARSSPALSELYYRNDLALASWIVYSKLGNFEAALKAHELYMATQDSLNNMISTRTINEIEQAFHKEENEKEIQRLAHQQEISSLNNKLLTAGISATVLLTLLLFLFFRQRNLKNKQDLLVTEQRLNRARMDPHFLFNTFTALQGLALREKDPVKTAGFLSDYSVIMRQTLESTFQELIPIEDEVAYLEKYLSLQQMRMAGKFNYAVSVADDIDPTELHVPGMIIQPFIENSIEHAFVNITHPGMLNIHFANTGSGLKITITDNGPGFSENKQDKTYPSRATGIIRDRLLLLNQKHKSSAHYTLESKTSGVTVIIHLPLLT